MTWACVVIWPMDDLASSGSLEGNCILCAVSTFLIKKNLKSLLYTKMLAISACNMLLTQGHFCKFKVSGKKKFIKSFCFIPSFWRNIGSYFFAWKFLLIFLIILIQSHLGKFNVIVQKYIIPVWAKFCNGK